MFLKTLATRPLRPGLTDQSYGLAGIIFLYPQVPGWVLLMWSRRYFQMDADSLLSVDKRRPILFLRAFQDDQKLK